MRSLIGIAVVVVCMVSIVSGGGCQHHAPDGASPSIDEYIRSLPVPPPGEAPPPTPVILSSKTNKYVGRMRCDAVTSSEGASFTQLAAFAPNADVLWPGSLVKGDSIKGGVLTPITVDRAPAFLTIGNMGNPADKCRERPDDPECSLSLKVSSPSLRTIVDGSRQLVGRHMGTGVAARTSQILEQYYTIEHAALKLSADARWMSGSVKASLNHSKREEESTWVVNFVQSYYDVSFNPPGRPMDFFDNGLFSAVSVKDLSDAGARGVRPAYVSTVTFGRMLILSVRTKESKSDTQAWLNAVVNVVTAGGSLDVALMNSSFVKQSEFNLLVLGGNPETAGKALSGTGGAVLPKLLEFYTADLEFTEKTPGVPISYQLRWLGTNDQVRMTFTTEYTVDECKPQRVVALGVRFMTQDDNKDRGHCVGIIITNGPNTVWRRNPVADCGHEWKDWDPVPQPSDAQFGGRAGWFSGPPERDLFTDSCPHLRVNVSKTESWGWKYKAAAAMWLEDGSEFNFLPLTAQVWKLGDGRSDETLSGYSSCER